MQEEELRAVVGELVKALSRGLEAAVVHVLEGEVRRALHAIAAPPEVADERVALGVALQHQERVELGGDDDRLDVGNPILMADVELFDALIPLAPRQLALDFRLRGVFVLVVFFPGIGRLAQNARRQCQRYDEEADRTKRDRRSQIADRRRET